MQGASTSHASFMVLFTGFTIHHLHDHDPSLSEFGYFYTLPSKQEHCSHAIMWDIFGQIRDVCGIASLFFLPSPPLSIPSFIHLQISKWLQGKKKKRLFTYLMVLFRLLFHLKVSIIRFISFFICSI